LYFLRRRGAGRGGARGRDDLNAGHGFGSDHCVDDGSSVPGRWRRKTGSIFSLGNIFRSTTWSAAAAPGLAVEKAIKISPEPLPEMLPSRRVREKRGERGG